MTENPADFWHPGKERRQWVEKLPQAKVIGSTVTYETAYAVPVKKPKIFDQFGRLIEPETPEPPIEPEANG